MHNAITAALVCGIDMKSDRKSDYSKKMLKEHKDTIQVLLNYGGKLDNGTGTRGLRAPIEFTRSNFVTSYFKKDKLPFHIMHSLNSDFERFSQSPFQWIVHEEIRVEIETYVNTIQNKALSNHS